MKMNNSRRAGFAYVLLNHSLSIGCLPAVAAGVLMAGCSVDILPVQQARIESVKKAEQPIARGPNAPGAFTKVWEFGSTSGFLFDPARIERTGGGLRLKAEGPSNASGPPYSKEGPAVETSSGAPYAALDGFEETLGGAAPTAGYVRYQLSGDGAKWWWHDGKNWVQAGPSFRMANSAAEVNMRIPSFHTDAGRGSLRIKAFLVSPDGTSNVELKSVRVRGVAPALDS